MGFDPIKYGGFGVLKQRAAGLLFFEIFRLNNTTPVGLISGF